MCSQIKGGEDRVVELTEGVAGGVREVSGGQWGEGLRKTRRKKGTGAKGNSGGMSAPFEAGVAARAIGEGGLAWGGEGVVRSLCWGGEAERWGPGRCRTQAWRGWAAATPLCHARRRQGRRVVGPGGSERGGKPVARGPAQGKGKKQGTTFLVGFFFSKFQIEFELKIEEGLGLEIQ
jgi:hypothetical protein